MIDPTTKKIRTRITILTPFVFLGIAWFLGPDSLPVPWVLVGILAFCGGVAFRMWASGYLVKDSELVCRGPFRYTRNPLYLGTCLLGLGFCAFSGRWESLLLLIVVIAGIYLPAVREEEQFLLERFGAAYADYQRAVPRWLPRLTPAPDTASSAGPYRWTLVRHNHEHLHLTVHLTLLLSFAAIYLTK